MHTDQLAELAARASTLGERIAGAVECHPDDPATADSRLARWSETVARGDAERFEARLALDGLDLESARLAVGRCSWPPDQPLPEWTSLIAEGLAELSSGDLDRDSCLPGEDADPIPLQELALPFVRAARRRLAPRLDPHRRLLAPEVVVELERRLLVELGVVAATVGELEFRCWRRPLIAPFDEAIERAAGQPGRCLYRDWVAKLRAGGLADLLRAYPVPARQIGVLALSWVDATAEFVERLAGDHTVLAETFSDRAALGRLETLGGARSDPHRGHRSVLECRFASGATVIYKPKALAAEAAYSGLVGWLNALGVNPQLRVLGVLDRGDYGWVEHAAHEPVDDPGGAARFYSRAGSLLALMHAIGGKDCHFENLIAAGEHPVVIDAETVLHPLLGPADPGVDDALRAAADRVERSVLGVGMLPSWIIAADGHAIDVSALGAVGPQSALEPLPDWDHPNTDVARIVLRSGSLPSTHSELRLAGSAQRPGDYVDNLCAGFESTYRLLCGRRDDLLAEDGPLARLRAAPVRALLRPTRVYLRILTSAAAPSRLGSGADHGIELEMLGRPLLDAASPSQLWELHRLEQRELSDRDVPYLSAPGSAPGLVSADGDPILSFEASALEAAARRLGSLGEDDLSLQLSLIEASLSNATSVPAADRRAALEPLDDSSRGNGASLDAARVLAEELLATAIRVEGSVAWVGLGLADEAEQWVLRPTGLDLYEGAAGIAVFLAALSRVDADPRWRAIALQTLAPVLRAVDRDASRLVLLQGLGAARGVGGVVFALALAADLLGDDRVLGRAQRLAHSVPVAAIDKDRNLDLLGGSAGLALGLLALERVSGPDPRCGELAHAAGRRIARAATRFEDGSPGWLTTGRRPLDGASHGTAGIALALARLAVRTGDEQFVALSEAAIRGESARYDAAIGGWPDRRADTEPVAKLSWCRGGAGIGLTRSELLALPLPDSMHVIARRDLERVKRALADGRGECDQLCCGRAGEIELLAELAAAGADGGIGSLLRSRSDGLAARILAGEPPRLGRPDSAGSRGVPAPGLFQGTAGVGLALLRSQRPGLPSVLTWR